MFLLGKGGSRGTGYLRRGLLTLSLLLALLTSPTNIADTTSVEIEVVIKSVHVTKFYVLC